MNSEIVAKTEFQILMSFALFKRLKVALEGGIKSKALVHKDKQNANKLLAAYSMEEAKILDKAYLKKQLDALDDLIAENEYRLDLPEDMTPKQRAVSLAAMYVKFLDIGPKYVNNRHSEFELARIVLKEPYTLATIFVKQADPECADMLLGDKSPFRGPVPKMRKQFTEEHELDLIEEKLNPKLKGFDLSILPANSSLCFVSETDNLKDYFLAHYLPDDCYDTCQDGVMIPSGRFIDVQTGNHITNVVYWLPSDFEQAPVLNRRWLNGLPYWKENMCIGPETVHLKNTNCPRIDIVVTEDFEKAVETLKGVFADGRVTDADTAKF